ncbi:MAG: 2Fe-2S iron-sulfur cluster-binding protein [Candidatus Omnitrophica bacterium]|nr:2Fe-2S iron-sulfur cluster-binding protein [Candidatus Omnitrophota bacterium]MCM8802070.1 2Fe-2S iron-sulfur cluster-binding protein [Candidatus Omnitrophota bacterium]
MENVEIIIDGVRKVVPKRITILKVAQELKIEIPTLCYHPAIEPYGACRLCTVEIEKNNRKMFVTSCNYPIENEIKIETNNENVIKIRKLILELLIAKVGYKGKVKEIAEKYNVEPRFGVGDDDCILCGLCVNVCKEIIGVNAISFSSRGINRDVSPPFGKEAVDCIGCGACAFLCPIGTIKIEDLNEKRIITKINANLELEKCKICGKYFVPKKFIEYIKNKIGNVELDVFLICDECKGENYIKRLASFSLTGGKNE